MGLPSIVPLRDIARRGICLAALSILVMGAHLSPARLPGFRGLVVLYAMPKGLNEEAFIARFAARGGLSLTHPVALGALGLIGQVKPLVAEGMTWQATIGRQVLWGQGADVKVYMDVESQMTMLSLGWSGKSLYGALAALNGGETLIGRVSAKGFDRQATVPSGIAALWSSSRGPQISVIQPNRILCYGPRFRSQGVVSGVQASFWMGARGDSSLVAYSQGRRRFGWAQVSAGHVLRQTTSDPRRALLGISDTNHPWGFGALGVVPWRGRSFDGQRLKPWPVAMPATISVAGNSQSPWIIFLAGMAQGLWFNTRTGRFGPGFHIEVPKGAVIRQVAPLTARG